jgi:hypothetical protein
MDHISAILCHKSYRQASELRSHFGLQLDSNCTFSEPSKWSTCADCWPFLLAVIQERSLQHSFLCAQQVCPVLLTFQVGKS